MLNWGLDNKEQTPKTKMKGLLKLETFAHNITLNFPSFLFLCIILPTISEMMQSLSSNGFYILIIYHYHIV